MQMQSFVPRHKHRDRQSGRSWTGRRSTRCGLPENKTIRIEIKNEVSGISRRSEGSLYNVATRSVSWRTSLIRRSVVRPWGIEWRSAWIWAVFHRERGTSRRPIDSRSCFVCSLSPSRKCRSKIMYPSKPLYFRIFQKFLLKYEMYGKENEAFVTGSDLCQISIYSPLGEAILKPPLSGLTFLWYPQSRGM